MCYNYTVIFNTNHIVNSTCNSSIIFACYAADISRTFNTSIIAITHAVKNTINCIMPNNTANIICIWCNNIAFIGCVGNSTFFIIIYTIIRIIINASINAGYTAEIRSFFRSIFYI